MRVHRALAAAALAAGLVAGGAPAAQADLNPPADGYGACKFSDGTLSSTELVVGTTHERFIDVHTRAIDCGSFAVHDGDEGVSGNPYLSFGSYVGGYLYSDDGDPSDVIGSPSAEPDSLNNEAAGQNLPGVIMLPDGTTRDFPGLALTLKRKTTVRVDAPSKVKKSKRFYVNGGLESADWNLNEYGQAFNKKVRLESRPSGGKWKTIKTVKTLNGNVEGGNLYYKTKIKKATCFRWVYAGDSTTAPVTSSKDCVKIKK